MMTVNGGSPFSLGDFHLENISFKTLYRMDNVGKRKVRTVFVTIQWREDEVTAECKLGLNITAKHAQDTRASVGGELPGRTLEAGVHLHSKRLLPSDRIVLNALRQRVPKGKQITTRVRTRELEAECEISRRQVQICVKRLRERGLIKRFIEDADLGGLGGYRYQLSKELLSE